MGFASENAGFCAVTGYLQTTKSCGQGARNFDAKFEGNPTKPRVFRYESHSTPPLQPGPNPPIASTASKPVSGYQLYTCHLATIWLYESRCSGVLHRLFLISQKQGHTQNHRRWNGGGDIPRAIVAGMAAGAQVTSLHFRTSVGG